MLTSALTRRKSGMVLVTILMVVMVMSIFAVNVLSQSLNQSASAKGRVDKIIGLQMAKGAFWKAYSDMSAGTANPTVGTENMNGRTYTVAADSLGTSPYTVTVTY